MTNDREYIIAILRTLENAVRTTAIKNADSNGRVVGSVIYYTEPTPLTSGGYVSLFAYRFANEGSGNGGIIRMSSPNEIETYLKGDRSSLVDLYIMYPDGLDDKVEDYYNMGSRGASLDYSRVGRNGANILPQVAVIVDNLTKSLDDFRKDFEDEYEDMDFVDYMNSSAVLSQDYITMLGGCTKVGPVFQSESGIGLRVVGYGEDGDLITTLTLSNDLKRATKSDLV